VSRFHYLAVALLALAAFGAWSVAAQDAAQPRVQWEYKHLPFLTGVTDEKKLMESFDVLGRDGWELVAVSGEQVAYFKRRK
jgi:hypothetical protein